MRNFLLRIITIFTIASTMFVIPADPTYAINNITFSTACRIQRPEGTGRTAFSVSAALHNNGLMYVAVNNSPIGGFREWGAGFYIVAYDPNDPTPDSNGICKPVASYIVQQPESATNSGKGRAKQMPPIVKADPSGNVFVGRVGVNGFRLLVIGADAPATPSGALNYDHMYSFSIGGGGGLANSGGGMDVSDDYMVASISADMTAPQRNRFTVVAKNTLFALGTIRSNQDPTDDSADVNDNNTEIVKTVTATWTDISIPGFAENGYTKFTSGSDAVAALPDGRFFLATAFEVSAGYGFGVTLAGFVNPATRAITNVYTGASGWTDLCGARDKTPFTNARPAPYGILGHCLMPSAYMGNDNNLYVGVRGLNAAEHVIIRYNTNLKRWEAPTGEHNKTFYQNNRYFESDFTQRKFGNGITADSAGQVFVGNIHNDFTTRPRFGPVDIAYYNLDPAPNQWKKIRLELGGDEWGKPHLMITPYSGESGRLSVLYVRNIWDNCAECDAIWATYKGDVYSDQYVEQCTVNMVVNGGLTFVNATDINVALYSSQSCTSTQYYAVATNSATPPSSVNTASLLAFDQANGAAKVTGLTANATNYVHVQLFDDEDNPTTSWMTQEVYADTSATVGATYTITSPFTKPRYTDVSTMDGSSYTASTFVRSNIGVFAVDAVTDPTGLSIYQINNDEPVNYSEALLGQKKLVLLRENAGMMGADVILRDGAGNSETRSDFSLTLDAVPPVAGTASISFADVASSPFNGEVTLTAGTASDNTGIWGLWLASAYCGADNTGCPADDSGDLRWGAVPLTSNVAEWNLLTGQNTEMASGVYRVYARLLDGAGNPSATVLTDDVSVTLSGHTVFAPIMYAER